MASADGTDADLLVLGAGTAGLPAAIEAVTAGVRVILVEAADRVGGTLHVSAGQMSGAGTRRQAQRGIVDTPLDHFDDVMRISRGTADPALVRRAVTLAGETLDWLMGSGFDMAPECPAILHFHEAYRTARTCWGTDGGRSILAVLTPMLQRCLATGRLDLRLRTRAVALAVEGGRVTGAHIEGPGGPRVVRARSTILTTGGYGGNPERFGQWHGGLPLYSAALPGSDGSGIALGLAAGGRLRSAGHHLPTFAGIAERPPEPWVLWRHLPQLTPQVRPPWEIYVHAAGHRFVREDAESVDARERALLQVPELTFHAVFDAAIAREAPPLLPGWTPAERRAAWREHPSFVTAGSLDELAQRAGIDAAGLARTVADYNAARAAGAADPLGRRHRPAPIERPPFHAVRMHGIVLKTAAGLAVDDALRVLDARDRPVPGLYAAGEAIGGGALSGNAFVGGMSVTPALGFGRWLGRTLARGLPPQQAALAWARTPADGGAGLCPFTGG